MRLDIAKCLKNTYFTFALSVWIKIFVKMFQDYAILDFEVERNVHFIA